MAVHVSHAALPYPIKHARFTIAIPYLDADGDPTDPTTPDTEFSLDNGAFADCAEEAAAISGSNGTALITLTGAETNGSILAIAAKVASGPKNTLATLYPRVLPILEASTAQAGASGTITLASGAAAYDLSGCIVRTTGGTGGGGTGGANNQARVITAYNVSTKVATIEPNWETTPDATTTYDILITEMACNAVVTRGLRPTTDGRTLDVASTGEAGLDFNNVLSTGLITLHSLTISGATTLSGAVSLGSTLSVTGGTTLAALSMTTLTASGAVAFQSTFAVTTSTSLAALSCTTLTASGAVAFQSTFAVTTSTSLAALSATTITASGTTSLAAVTTSGTVTLNALTVTNALTVSGATSLAALSTSGTATFNALTVTNATTLSGAVSLGSTLSVTGTTTLAALSMTTFTASGAVALQSTLTVTGTTTLTGAVTASNASNNIVGAKLHSAGLDAVLIESGISASASLTDDAATQLTSINARQALSLMLAAPTAGVLAGAATTTITIKGAGLPSGNTRITATVDSDGNRTALILKVPT